MDWRPLLTATYRRLIFAQELPWKKTFAAVPLQDAGKCQIFPSPNGGPIAILFLEPQTSAGVTRPCLRVHTSLGSLIYEAAWPHFGFAAGGWADGQTFVAVFADGTVRVFLIDGETRQFFNVLPLSKEQKSISCASVGEDGILLTSDAGDVWWNDSHTEQKLSTWLDMNSSALSKSRPKRAVIRKVAVLTGSDRKPVSLIVTHDGLLFQVWAGGYRQILLTPSDSCESQLHVVDFAFSATKRLIAFLSDDSFIAIGSGSSLTNAERDPAQGPIKISVSLVNSPAIDMKQFTWVADHCIAIVVSTPTTSCLQQHCVFIGGPGKKWLDYIMPSMVVVQSEIDGLRYWRPDVCGFIHMATGATEALFGPGSCEPAGMLLFAHENKENIAEAEQSGDEPDSADWTAETERAASRLDETYRDYLANEKLKNSDLHLVFYQAKWSSEQKRAHKAQVHSENETQKFLRSLTADERDLAIMQTVEAVKDEWEVQSISTCLKLLNHLLDGCTSDVGKQSRMIYFQLMRDFRLIFNLRNAPREMAMSYRQFRHVGLLNICEALARRGMFDFAIQAARHFELAPLYHPTASELDSKASEFRKTYRQLHGLIHRNTIMRSVSSMVTNAQDADTDEALLQRVKAKASELREDEALARQAAWAGAKSHRIPFAKLVMQKEKNPLIRLYFKQGVKDHGSMLSDALTTLDRNHFDYFLVSALPQLLDPECKMSNFTEDDKTLSSPQYAVHEVQTSLKACCECVPPIALERAVKYMAARLKLLPSAVPLQIGEDSPKDVAAFKLYKAILRGVGRACDLVWSSLWAVQASSLKTLLASTLPPLPVADREETSSTFIVNLMSAPLSSLTNAVLNPTQGDEKSFPVLRRDVWEAALKDIEQIKAACKLPTPNEAIPLDPPGHDLADILQEHLQLLQFQMRVADVCRKSQGGLSKLVGLGGKVRLKRQQLSTIEWEAQPMDTTGEMLVSHSGDIENGEALVEEFRKTFSIEKKKLLIWKLLALAKKHQWAVFMDCAVEAVKCTAQNRLGGRTGLFIPPVSTLTSALSSAFGKDSSAASTVQAESAAHFSAFLRERHGTKLSEQSGLTSTLLNVMSSRNSQQSFMPLLPNPEIDTTQTVDNSPVCPQLLPPSAFARMHVLDFISVAAANGRPDIALALVPYVANNLIREKWGMHLSLRDAQQVDEFSRRAIEAALSQVHPSRSSSGSSLVWRLIQGAKLAEPVSGLASELQASDAKGASGLFGAD